MQEKKRLSINIIAQFVSFLVQFAISFLMTPFIVKKLGAEAYGFIGLSNNFISYAQILTVALNSMAGRFIAVEYHKGNLVGAQKYYASVFYANIIVSTFIGIIAIICSFYLEYFVNIPVQLIFDVKVLFILLIGNFLISLIFSVYNVATFIKNRLDYVAVRSIVANVIRACVLVIAFSFFVPMLWYVGLASVICTLYISFVNIQYKRQLTPDLVIRPKLYDFEFVRKIVNSGVWNTVSRLSNILEQGFDLLFANLFIGTYAMGQLAITKQIPVIILTLIGSIGAAFAPSLTKSFAQGSKSDMQREVMISVKLMGLISVLPLCFVFSFIDRFYDLWLPGQNSSELYLLTVIGVLYFPILLSLEGVQNLWPVLNKVKTYSLASIVLSSCTFITLFTGIHFIPKVYSIYYLAGVSTFYNFILVLFFIPLYAAKCLGVSKTFFYPSIVRVVITVVIVLSAIFFIKPYLGINSWPQLIFAGMFEVIICLMIGFMVILNRDDRRNIISIVKRNKS